MNNPHQALGSRISLVSKSEIRYEGFLHAINAEENTVALKNVRMFGTEGRKGDASQEIAPGDQLYDFIIFRGADIKDLTVFEDTPRDPAIVRSKPASGPGGKVADNRGSQQAFPRGAAGSSPAMGQLRPGSTGGGRGAQPPLARGRGGFDGQQGTHMNQSHQGQRQGQRGNDNYGGHYNSRNDPYPRRGDDYGGYNRAQRDDHYGGNYRGGGRDNYGGGRDYGRRDNYAYGGRRDNYGGGGANRRDNYGRKSQGKNRQGGGQGRKELHTGRDFEVAKDHATALAEFKDDFDFSAEGEKAKKTPAEAPVEGQKSYDKVSSFFDSISCEAKDKEKAGERHRPTKEDREQAQKLDLETFGNDLVQSYNRGGHRGGGRGFRRRY